MFYSAGGFQERNRRAFLHVVQFLAKGFSKPKPKAAAVRFIFRQQGVGFHPVDRLHQRIKGDGDSQKGQRMVKRKRLRPLQSDPDGQNAGRQNAGAGNGQQTALFPNRLILCMQFLPVCMVKQKRLLFQPLIFLIF